LPPRPPIKTSGLEKATDRLPAGSRHTGCEEIIVQAVAFRAEVTLYRRERWVTSRFRRCAALVPRQYFA
jgi:hypothetical protein